MPDAAAHRDGAPPPAPHHAPPRPERPLLEMLTIAAPSVVTMTSYTVMQFVDGLMVSRIGPDPVYVAAQFNGGLASFVPISFVMGLLGVINTYVSQNLGAGRPERGSAYAWTALWVSLLAGICLLPYALLVPHIFALPDLRHGAELQRLETAYAQILLAGASLTIASRGIAHFFYGLHRPATVMLAAVAGNCVNVFFNYVLIYGHFGARELGVPGAAIATVIGTAAETAVTLAVFLSPAWNARYGTRGAWRPSLAHARDIVRIGWPAALMFGNEMVCWAYFMVVLIPRFGETHNFVGAVALRYMHLSFMPAIGISIAVTAVVGKCMGMRRPDLAARRAYLGLGVTMAYMGVCALAMLAFRGPMIGLFIEEGTPADDVEEILRVGGWVMVIAAFFQLFDAMAITLSGALRGAGDTVWPGVVTVTAAWVCIVGGGHFFIEFYPRLESLGPWLGAAAYIIVLGVYLTVRFLRGAWKRIDVLGRAEGAAVGAMVEQPSVILPAQAQPMADPVGTAPTAAGAGPV